MRRTLCFVVKKVRMQAMGRVVCWEKGWRVWGMGSRRTSSLVVEDTTEVVAVREDVGLMGEVGAAGVDEVDAWETYRLGVC